MKKEARLGIRLLPEEHQLLKLEAFKDNKTVSEWVLDAIFKKLKKSKSFGKSSQQQPFTALELSLLEKTPHKA